MATVVIGGLFTSTFLTLLVVPVLYSLVDGGKTGFAKRFGDVGSDEPTSEVPKVQSEPVPAPAEG